MNRIAELRKERGFSQSKVAEYIGVAQNTLSQYETEQRNLPIRIMMELVKLFGVSPAYLMGETDSRGEGKGWRMMDDEMREAMHSFCLRALQGNCNLQETATLPAMGIHGQTAILAQIKESQQMVKVITVNGYQLRGKICAYDRDIIVLTENGEQRIVFKSAISTIVPSNPIAL